MTGPRIYLVHAYRPSIAPSNAAFVKGWPEAEMVNLLDEGLYSDVNASGVYPPTMPERIAGLFRHCVLSGAKGIIFTGTAFGPVVDQVRDDVPVPVLKPDEAMADEAVARGGSILVLGTAARALPVIRGNAEAAAKAAGASVKIGAHWIDGAQAANDSGDAATHDRLVAEAAAAATDWDTVMLGQMSMLPARALMSADLTAKVLTSPEAAVARMKQLVVTT